MNTPTLLPTDPGLRIDYLDATSDTITITVETVAPSADCPLCGRLSEHVHSRYRRKLSDLPWNWVSVRIHLRTRKFFCDNPLCERTIFTEPVPVLAARYARKTVRLQETLYLIGYALGGEAGARVALGLGLTVSPDTLLRRVRQEVSATNAEASTVRVLGVDDWAFRRGQRYGTILVDLERRCLVDLLPERSAESLAEWLKAHPGVEILSRDRAEVYAEGARQGAPQAQQVADRWHLLKNMGDALDRLLWRHHRHLRETAQKLAAQTSPPEDTPPKAPERPLTRAEQARNQQREKRAACYAQVYALHQQGFSQSAIERRTGLARATIRKYLRAETCPLYPVNRRQRPGFLTPYTAFLKRRWEEGCHNAAQLFGEIQAQGYRGHYSILRKYLQSWRSHLPESEQRSTTGPAARRRPREETPSAQQVRWWLLGHFSKSDVERGAWQKAFVATLVELCAEVKSAQVLAEEFGQMVKKRLPDPFENWIEKARDCGVAEIQRFAGSLCHDKSAIQAALSTPWSNGQTEGQVNRLKFIKRQMYGRAKFDLLRARVLPRAIGS